MQDYGAMIRSTFGLGSVRDAELLFETIVEKRFPHLYLPSSGADPCPAGHPLSGRQKLEPCFEIRKGELDSFPVWEVNCHRVTMGKTPDKQVYLDYLTLDFIRYRET